MMKQMIREANTKDVEAVGRLFDAYRVFYGKVSDPEGARRFITERLEQRESKIFLAEFDGSPCGFIQLYPLFSSTRMQRLWLLNDLFVDPAYRARGIARLLLERAKEWAVESGSAGFFLETARDNLAANALYRSAGLELDESHHYYSLNTDKTN